MALARLRRRYLLAMGMPALAGAMPSMACTRDGASPLVTVPLVDGDAGTLAVTAFDAGYVATKPATSSSAKTFHDPPEPVPPRWSHTATNQCPDAVEAPDPAELPAPFEQCPKQVNGGQFSAKATRAQRAENPDACCYVQFRGMIVPGRALRDAGGEGAVVARAELRRDWLEAIDPVDVRELRARERAALAAAWRRDAALEHASVASFAQLALDLMALGAPAALVTRAHEAALDEITHARLCYALAASYDGVASGPGPLAVPHRLEPATFEALVRETFVDGCLGETIATLEAREARACTTVPAVAAVLERVALDEERHAELAFVVLAWLVTAGGARAHAALANALASIEVGASIDARDDATIALHGRLGRAARSGIRARAVASIVEPCALALLAQRAPTSASTAARS